MIRFYLKITGEFLCLILQDIFLVMHIQFVRMAKHQFLGQFQVDYLSIKSGLLLYFFFVNLLYTLIM